MCCFRPPKMCPTRARRCERAPIGARRRNCAPIGARRCNWCPTGSKPPIQATNHSAPPVLLRMPLHLYKGTADVPDRCLIGQLAQSGPNLGSCNLTSAGAETPKLSAVGEEQVNGGFPFGAYGNEPQKKGGLKQRDTPSMTPRQEEPLHRSGVGLLPGQRPVCAEPHWGQPSRTLATSLQRREEELRSLLQSARIQANLCSDEGGLGCVPWHMKYRESCFC